MTEPELFSALLQNLLHLKVASFETVQNELKDFSEKYCYHAALQPMFTEEALSRVVSEMIEGMIYELQDPLGIRVEVLRIKGRTYLIGPFVTEILDEYKAQSVLITHHLPASFATSVKLYYTAFPVVGAFAVTTFINAFLRALFQIKEDYAFYRLTEWNEPLPAAKPQYREYFDYETISRRYEDENRFLRFIEMGDTENVLQAYDGMSVAGMTEKRYYNAVYQDIYISFAMVRALARKAAERGGASLLEIDEITQQAVQKSLLAKDAMAASDVIREMILELTEAVRKHKLYEGNYSAPIRKAAEYIRLNFSQELPLGVIAGKAGLTSPYLSRQFKNEVGMTVSQYIQHLRCLQAARLLRETDSPIADISAYVGYPDGNYFVKVFKKQYGVTPSEYRTKNR